MKIKERELSCTAGPMAMGAATNGESDSPTVEQQQQLYLNGGSEGLNEMPHGQSKQPKKQPFSSSSSSCEDDSDDGPDDESGKKVPSMVVDDHEFHPSSLLGLSKLRKNRQFCDVILQVGTSEIPAHRVILACCSPYLFELFSADDGGKCSEENIITYKLNGGFEKDSLEHLINYAYTGQMEVKATQVKAVYVAASRLKMERAVNYCAQYLVDHLDPATAIEIRALPGIQRKPELAARVDSFLAAEIASVVTTSALRSLPLIQVEVLANTREEIGLRDANVTLLCHLVLEWMHRNWEPAQLNVDQLTAKTHLLYLNLDNSLHDCIDIESGDVIDSDIVQDYKRMSMRLSHPGGKNRRRGSSQQQPTRPRHTLYSRSISEVPTGAEAGAEEFEWRVVAATPMSEKSIMALTVINGRMTTLSVLQRLNNTVTGFSSNDATMTPLSTPGHSRHSSVERSTDCLSAIPHMSTPRCAVGCANLNNTLLVCGGYDRGECLRTVELYDPLNNRWSQLPSMREARGRFDITVIDGKVYAVGGCNGTTELATAEVYSSDNAKWTALPPLESARSNIGVCDLGGKVYCIGGWNGQCGMKQCNVFDPAEGKWQEMAPLNYGRYQAAVTTRSGKLYAVGGCDAWNCLNTVEVYDPETGVWDFLPSMNTARRGCGVTLYQNKLCVVGGSDGCQSLCTTEMFDFETNAWSPGPSMTSCRANISVAVIDGKLFAVGGFSGKVFLNSVEFLDPETMEWTTFVNRGPDDARPAEASASLNSFSRRESQSTLPSVDEEEQQRPEPTKRSSLADSSGCESDEHSS